MTAVLDWVVPSVGKLRAACTPRTIYVRKFLPLLGKCNKVMAYAAVDEDAMPLVGHIRWDSDAKAFLPGYGVVRLNHFILHHYRPELFPLQDNQRVSHRNGNVHDCRVCNLYVHTPGPKAKKKKSKLTPRNEMTGYGSGNWKHNNRLFIEE